MLSIVDVPQITGPGRGCICCMDTIDCASFSDLPRGTILNKVRIANADSYLVDAPMAPGVILDLDEMDVPRMRLKHIGFC